MLPGVPCVRGRGEERRETPRVDRLVGDVQAVARAAADEHAPGPALRRGLVLQQPPQLRDKAVQGRDRGLRGVVAPELVDQPVARERPAGLDHEQRQEQRAPPAAERHGTAIALRGERAEHGELETRHRVRRLYRRPHAAVSAR